jgi:hypothetical protein
VIARRTGFIAGAALAVGLALGFGGSALAANPTASPDYRSMMGGHGMMSSSFGPGSAFGPGMMGGASFASGSTFGPGMMGGLSQEQLQQMLQRCDQIHDAMHDSFGASPSPSTTPVSR